MARRNTTRAAVGPVHAGVGFRTDITVRDFAFVADEPKAAGDTDSGATPYEYVLGDRFAQILITGRSQPVGMLSPPAGERA